MRSLKKKIKEQRIKTHQRVSAWLQPKVSALGQRYRLAARIRFANKWASKHPKRTFVLVTATLLSLLVGSIAIDCLKAGPNKEEPTMESIADVNPMLDGFRAIQSGKSLQRQSLQDLAVVGQNVRHSLDSLIALPNKSHADSIRIIRSYRQLEQIVNSLKQHTDDNKD